MNAPLNTIEAIESALSDLLRQIEVYFKSHWSGFTIEQTYSKQAKVLGVVLSIPTQNRLSLRSINRDNREIIGMMGIEMCPVSNGMEIVLPPLHIIIIENTRRLYEQYLLDNQFPPTISVEGKEMFARMKQEGITGEQCQQSATKQAEDMIRTESWRFDEREKVSKWEGQELGFRVKDNRKFQDFIKGMSMVRLGEYQGIINFVKWVSYILEEKMKYHFFCSQVNGADDLLSVYGFLPQIVELVQKHHISGSGLEKYFMHMKQKTVREYAELVKAGYDFHAMPTAQPLMEVIDFPWEKFKHVMQEFATVLTRVEKNINAQSMGNEALLFARSLIAHRQRKFPGENLDEVRNMFR